MKERGAFHCYAKCVRNHSSRKEVYSLLDFINRSAVFPIIKRPCSAVPSSVYIGVGGNTGCGSRRGVRKEAAIDKSPETKARSKSYFAFDARKITFLCEFKL